jgi:pimeloyl-ACP methyl ester carboxylesterase
MRERRQVNGVQLCVESFGRPGDPPILLVGGAGASMDWWDETFCGRLAGGGRFVVRYDHRDTGESVSYPAGTPGYTAADLVADAAGVAASFGPGATHVVGISMGGALAQLIALDHPDRVASLTLISTTAGPGDDDLPPPDDRLKDLPPPPADATDRAAVVTYLVESERVVAGRGHPFDAAAKRALAERVFDRSRDMAASLVNHYAAEGGAGWRHRLREIAVPTLVLHGTDDPMFPLPHGAALAAEIPPARLVPLDGVGHEMPPPAVWDLVTSAILTHTAPA